MTRLRYLRALDINLQQLCCPHFMLRQHFIYRDRTYGDRDHLSVAILSKHSATRASSGPLKEGEVLPMATKQSYLKRESHGLQLFRMLFVTLYHKYF